MTSAIERADEVAGPFDKLAEDLQRLRIDSGGASYAEIAARIARMREAQGMSQSAAQVARSSVFDVFRAGRRRVNPELVVEIVIALGEDAVSAEVWRRRCLDARMTALPVPAARRTPSEATLRAGLMVALLAACVGLNLFGGAVVIKLDLPLFLDMAGTAAAAIAFGPWHGVLVGVATNALGAILSTPETIAFALVNVVGALVWGYGVRRFGAGRTHLRFLLLNLVAAFACTLVAVPTNVLLYGGMSGTPSATAAATLLAMGNGLLIAMFSANMLSSLADKLVAGYLGLIFARLVEPLGLRAGLRDDLPIAISVRTARRTAATSDRVP